MTFTIELGTIMKKWITQGTAFPLRMYTVKDDPDDFMIISHKRYIQLKVTNLRAIYIISHISGIDRIEKNRERRGRKNFDLYFKYVYFYCALLNRILVVAV